MTDYDITVCVAVYRRHRAPNLASLAASLPDAAAGRSWELVVALNGIDAGSAGVPAGARTVRFIQNQGVPIAWNGAAAQARGRILCIVNDDVVLGAKSLHLLVEALRENPRAGVVGPVGTMWDLERATHRSYVDTSGLVPGQTVGCDVLSGFLLVTPADVFAAVGGFDEALTPCGFEEVDYCTAVRRQAKRDVLVVAGVPVQHRFGISARRGHKRISYMGRSERLEVVAERNRAHFVRKWSAQ